MCNILNANIQKNLRDVPGRLRNTSQYPRKKTRFYHELLIHGNVNLFSKQLPWKTKHLWIIQDFRERGRRIFLFCLA